VLTLENREFFIAWKRALSKIGCSITGDAEEENETSKGGPKLPQPQQPPPSNNIPKWPMPKDIIKNKVSTLPPIDPNPKAPPKADPEPAN
jgi:hypothetical protein